MHQEVIHALNIAYVAPGFERLPPRLSMSAMTAYASHLLSQISRAAQNRWTLTILTTCLRRASPATGQSSLPSEMISQFPIRVERCFRGRWTGFVTLFFVIRRHRFDLVHLQHETNLYGGPLSILLFPLFVLALRAITLPVVTLHHVIRSDQVNTAFTKMHHTHLPPILIRWGYGFFYRLLGMCAPSIIVHDALFRDILVQEYAIPEEHIAIIPHGVEDPTATTPALSRQELFDIFHIPRDAETVFSFFGYFTGYKGLDFLIEEFSQHVRQHPKSILVIGGLPSAAHSEKASYQAFIQRLRQYAEHSAPGRIIWHGAVTDDQVGRFFRLTDCLVLPYRLSFASSGPLSYAIGSSTPFLASEALRPFVPYETLLFPLRQGALAEKLTAFASLTPQERNALTIPLQALRQEHQWSVVARLTMKEYERTLARASHRTDILLLGAYGQQNLGDELLLETCLSHLPRESCTVASAQPQRTEREHSVHAVPSRFSWSLLRAFLRAKTLLIGGGDQFKLLKRSMGRRRYSLLLRETLLVLFAKLLGKEVIFLGVGIGNISTPFARLLTATTLRFADHLTLRDQESIRTAQKLAPQSAVSLGADLTFLWQTDRRPPSACPAVRKLGIAPAFDLDHAEVFPSICRELGGALDGFLGQDPQREVVLLPFQTGFHPHDDIRTSREILEHVEQRGRCRMNDHLDISTTDGIYHSLSVVWGMRLHSLILACLHAVPFIALIYDVKVQRFLEEIGCTEWGIELDASFSAPKLLALHRHLESCSQDVSHHLHTQAERLTARAQVNAQFLRSLASEFSPATSDLPSTFVSESTPDPSS